MVPPLGDEIWETGMISRTHEALQRLIASWTLLKNERPHEADFTPYGHALSYSMLDEYFSRLQVLITSLDSKGYWVSSLEAAVAEQPLVALFNQANDLVNAGRSNGVTWMLQSGFLTAINSARQQISTLGRNQAALNKEIAKVLALKSDADIELVVAAGSTARSISEFAKQAQESSNKLSEDAEFITETLHAVSAQRDELAGLAKETEQLAESVKDIQLEAKASQDVANELRKHAIAQEELLSTRQQEVKEQVETLEREAKSAQLSVQQALKDARTEGLAKAFQDRSTKLQSERGIWALAFVVAIVVLLVLACVFQSDLKNLTYESLVVALLKRLGIVAPAIWFGWYAARQLGRISRVQEDYEFKVATALAYQSYRDEISALASEELREKFAEVVIENFGNNPVRLYENTKHDDSVSPSEAMLKNLSPEQLTALWADGWNGVQALVAKK